MSENLIRELTIRAKVYRIIAMVFAFLGFLVFAVLFHTKYEGHLLRALHDPASVLLFFVPFLPAVVLTWLAGRAERKRAELLESLRKSS